MGPRKLLGLLRANLATHTEMGWFCNLDNHRPTAQVHAEIKAVLATRPAWLEMCETIGNDLPDVHGYRLIRDRSTPGRANIAAYVRVDLPVTHVHWHDLDFTWPRTEGPGVHPARSFLEYHAAGIHRLVGHQPPRNVKDAVHGQEEGVDVAVAVLAPWRDRDLWRSLPRRRRLVERLRPRGLAWDSNRRWDEPDPGPRDVARRIRGVAWFKGRIDNWVTRHMSVTDEAVVSVINPNGPGRAVRFGGDHGHLIRGRVRVRAVWVEPKPRKTL